MVEYLGLKLGARLSQGVKVRWEKEAEDRPKAIQYSQVREAGGFTRKIEAGKQSLI